MNEENIFIRSKEVWENNLIKFPETLLKFPSENLVRLFSGRYLEIPLPPAKIMDHGFGHGNNLFYFADLGYECYGCEISKNLIDVVNCLGKERGVKIDLRLIDNLKLPFDDNMFDIIISWDVLHYNGTKESLQKIIDEFLRILKKGGILLLSTVHPDSSIFDRVEHLGNNSYAIVKESKYDNRKDLTFYIAQTTDEIMELYRSFREVKIGKYYYNLFNDDKRHAAYLIYGVK